MTGDQFEFQRRDLEYILSLGERALGCESMNDLQQEILLRIQQAARAESSVYFDVVDTSLGWQFVNGISYGVPEKGPQTWCDHYQTVDPFTSCLLHHLEAGSKRIITTEETILDSDYMRTEFYCDFLRPQSIYHMMVVGLPGDSRPVGLIGLHRSPRARAFTAKEVSKINAVVPYISAAVRKIKLAEMAAERQEIIGALSGVLNHSGIVILDKNLLPIFLDENACALFEVPPHRGHGLKCASNGFLPPEIVACCEVSRQQANACHDVEAEHHTEFMADLGAKQIGGTVCSYRTKAGALNFLICLKAQKADLIRTDNLQKFNLTRREIDIAHLISIGMSNREIARKLFISVRTVQNHLRSIYHKAEVHNRTSLVSRLMQ